MTNSTDDDDFKIEFKWPGYPAIPPCVADEFQFEDLDPYDEDDRKLIWTAWTKALKKQSPVFAGVDGLHAKHFWGPKWCDGEWELSDAVFLMQAVERARDPQAWPEFRELVNADIRWIGGTEYDEARWYRLGRAARPLIDVDPDGDEMETALRAWLAKPGGRAPSYKTTDAQRVKDALNVSTDRAYKILRWGTGKIENRVKLAGVFAHDLTRNTPDAWELKSGSSWGGARRTFGEYCLKGVDPWADTRPVLDVVRGFLERGALSINPTFEELAYTVKPTGTDATDLVDLWSNYKAWRNG